MGLRKKQGIKCGFQTFTHLLRRRGGFPSSSHRIRVLTTDPLEQKENKRQKHKNNQKKNQRRKSATLPQPQNLPHYLRTSPQKRHRSAGGNGKAGNLIRMNSP